MIAGLSMIYAADEVLGGQAKELPEQLQESVTIHEMARDTDNIIFSYFKRIKSPNITDGVTAVSQQLCSMECILSVSEYARI